MHGNILATENQQAIINYVIDVKVCICMKPKQMQLRKNEEHAETFYSRKYNNINRLFFS